MNYILIAFGLIIFIYLISKYIGSSGGGNFENITPAEAKGLQKQGKIEFLDVRTPTEIKGGKIKNAKELNVTGPGFLKGLSKLDKSKTYVVYCRSGNRSRKACKVMETAGFEHLYNLQGGYMSWN